MIRFRAKRRRWVAAIGAAVAFHLALGIFLALSQPWSGRVGLRTPRSERAAAPEAESDADDAAASPASVDRAELRGRIEASLGAFSGEDEQRLAERATKAANWLESRSSEAAIDDIGEVVREACAAPRRAYSPIDPPPPGDFDHDTMLPYAVRHTVGEDGSTQVVYTWVDQQGRSIEVEAPLETSDPALTTALQMAQRSPMMRRLFETSVLPVLEAQLRPQR